MADNVDLAALAGTCATDDVAGIQYQRVKLAWGVDGTADDASAAAPLPVVQTGTLNVGTVTAVTALSNALPAGTNNIGDVDVLTVPADPFGANADAASATGSISAKLRFIAATGIPITGSVTVGSHAVTNAGTFATQVDGAALTALQLIDDPVATLGTTTYTEAASKGMIIGAVRRDADTTLVDTTNEVAPLQVNAGGQLKVAVIAALPAGTNNIGDVDIVSGTITTVSTVTAVTAITNALPAGTNAIGKLAANDGVDIGDVDIKSYSTATLTSLASAATSAQVLASTAGRKGCMLHNTDANNCFLKFGTTATTAIGGYTVKIPADGYWEMPLPTYTGRIDAIWDVDGSGGLSITEIT